MAISAEVYEQEDDEDEEDDLNFVQKTDVD
jgi:hypothetical protein